MLCLPFFPSVFAGSSSEQFYRFLEGYQEEWKGCFFCHQLNENGDHAIKHKTASALAAKSQHERFVRVDMRESGADPSV